jgi:hypothetical protein
LLTRRATPNRPGISSPPRPIPSRGGSCELVRVRTGRKRGGARTEGRQVNAAGSARRKAAGVTRSMGGQEGRACERGALGGIARALGCRQARPTDGSRSVRERNPCKYRSRTFRPECGWGIVRQSSVRAPGALPLARWPGADGGAIRIRGSGARSAATRHAPRPVLPAGAM